MSDQSTIYDVITRYSVEDKASAPVERIARGAERADKHVKSLGLGLGTLTRNLTGAYIGFQALRIGERIITGLNEQMNRTIQVASQVNLAFKFDTNPAAQF